MPRGGKREGAGRPPEGKAPAQGIKVRLAPDLHQRLQWVCEALDCTHGEVMELGIEAAEARAAKERGSET